MGFVIGGAVIRFSCFLLGSIVLTKLIAPEDFARLIYIGVPLSLASLFGDFGLGEGAIRLKRVDSRIASLFLWISLSAAFVCALVFLAFIPLFELWFHGTELMDLGLAFAAVVLVQGFQGQYRALLRRQMRLKLLSTSDVVTSVIANGISVTLAFFGFGVIAIPLGRLAALVCELIIFVGATGWIPGRMAKLSETSGTLGFGFKLAASGFFHFGMSSISAFVLGRMFPEELLGYLERANTMAHGVTDRLRQVVSRVMFPLLSRSQHGPRLQFEDLATSTHRILARLTILPSLLLVPFVPHAVLAIFGEEWVPMGSYLGWIIFGVAMAIPSWVAVMALLSAGGSGTLLKINIGIFVLRMLVLAITVLWYRDLWLYVVVVSISEPLVCVVVTFLSARFVRIRARVMLRNVMVPFLIGVSAILVLQRLIPLIGVSSSLGVAVVLGGAAVIIPFWYSGDMRVMAGLKSSQV
jgi:O-antigen/teichoic acid export membrane protein